MVCEKARLFDKLFYWSLLIFFSGCLCVSGQRAWGAIGQFKVWTPAPGIQLLLPVPEGMTADIAARRYLGELQNQGCEALGYLPEPIHFGFNYSPDAFCDLQTAAGGDLMPSGPRMLIVANRFGHMLANDPFPHVRQKLSSFGANVHILPLSLPVLLTKAEIEDVRRFIISYYHGLVAIGGSDLHPALYGSQLATDAPAYLAIDQFELDLVKAWLGEGRGALFGICRGHQLIAVLLGCRLVQELEYECPGQGMQHRQVGVGLADQATSYQSAWHDITLCDGPNALFEAVGLRQFRVNSRHHQAVLRHDFEAAQRGARIAAIAGDVVEALDLGDQRGFTVQFHPEDMETPEGDLVMKDMVTRALRVKERGLLTQPAAVELNVTDTTFPPQFNSALRSN